ncbi:arylamine N-acetyltransferase family protein [Monashia sp. NPDC004114]
MTSPTTLDTLTPAQVTAYLGRLGAMTPAAPTLAALSSLQRAHLLAVPFENLDIALGRPISVEPADAYDKVVVGHRGGYCYELNGLFAALLRALGYAVDHVSAQVAVPGGGLTAEFDHLVLLVTSPAMDGTALVDVGFGDAFVEPIPLRDGAGHHELGKDVGLERDVDGTWLYRERRDGEEWHTQYVFTSEPHPLAAFAERNLWQQTSPDSHFTQKSVVSRLTETGRITLSDRRLITTTHGRRDERELDEAAASAALAEHFGIVLG